MCDPVDGIAGWWFVQVDSYGNPVHAELCCSWSDGDGGKVRYRLELLKYEAGESSVGWRVKRKFEFNANWRSTSVVVDPSWCGSEFKFRIRAYCADCTVSSVTESPVIDPWW